MKIVVKIEQLFTEILSVSSYRYGNTFCAYLYIIIITIIYGKVISNFMNHFS